MFQERKRKIIGGLLQRAAVQDDDCHVSILNAGKSAEELETTESSLNYSALVGPPEHLCTKCGKPSNCIECCSQNSYQCLKPDKSLKGSVDSKIAGLCDLINSHSQFVTTSSCSGRITVYQQAKIKCGKRKKNWGKLLFVSHEPVACEEAPEILRRINDFDPFYSKQRSGDAGGPSESFSSFIKSEAIREGGTQTVCADLKFEPLVVHVECSNLNATTALLSLCTRCGLRNSGINCLGKRCVVALRGGQRLEVPVAMSRVQMRTKKPVEPEDGVEDRRVWNTDVLVDAEYLSVLLRICNEKMELNAKQIERVFNEFKRSIIGHDYSDSDAAGWFVVPDVERRLKDPVSLLLSRSNRGRQRIPSLLSHDSASFGGCRRPLRCTVERVSTPNSLYAVSGSLGAWDILPIGSDLVLKLFSKGRGDSAWDSWVMNLDTREWSRVAVEIMRARNFNDSRCCNHDVNASLMVPTFRRCFGAVVRDIQSLDTTEHFRDQVDVWVYGGRACETSGVSWLLNDLWRFHLEVKRHRTTHGLTCYGNWIRIDSVGVAAPYVETPVLLSSFSHLVLLGRPLAATAGSREFLTDVFRFCIRTEKWEAHRCLPDARFTAAADTKSTNVPGKPSQMSLDGFPRASAAMYPLVPGCDYLGDVHDAKQVDGSSVNQTAIVFSSPFGGILKHCVWELHIDSLQWRYLCQLPARPASHSLRLSEWKCPSARPSHRVSAIQIFDEDTFPQGCVGFSDTPHSSCLHYCSPSSKDLPALCAIVT